ncbi:asparagine synthase-related protein [Halobacillus amylolyticus]|uniref:asparagine synthase (glutamine-hydrolyzing) n=1 Tax=Halobacillus amylolyticus TaxID=2932259 RepID=A0ABY4HFV7_9BACI|nr:asparagine synthase-related protein [Halobacillus amylolyticus]UOR13777.1 asparagine synthase-related protein [Halobacillus amylolyticus]
MSAIAGIFHANGEPVSAEQSNGLIKAFQHYPADDIRTFHRQNVFFGCHAQWITPESIGEVLPYYDYERQLAITADAIIDNREELFDRLHVDRALRKIIPDSQLILLAYHKWGEDVPAHLMGDFAFMIWDEKERKLFGARDFSGSRSLYFYNDQSRLAFSTTIAPLFTLPYIEKNLNEEWLAEFLVIPNMVEAVDMSSTVYHSINQVPPSNSITIKKGRVSLSRYCTFGSVKRLKLKSKEEYAEAFRDVFQKAVTDRIRTHGEVGAHLSGGLDSGSVVSFAAKELKKEKKRLHTFSYIPEDTFSDWTPKYYMPDERPFIKETVDHAGNISDQYLNFEGESSLSEVDDFLELMEMPYKFFENSFWLKGINETAHQQGIKVLLNGARGNHSISWGSWNLNMEYYASLLKKVRWLKLNRELGRYRKRFHTGKSNLLPVITKRAFPAISQLFNKEEGYESQISKLIHPSLAKRTNVIEKMKEYDAGISGGDVGSLTEYRNSYFQKPHVWNKSGVVGTKLSLRYALWDRDPTNDLNVIKFCLSLPEELYVQNGMERSFIRGATKHILPEKVRLNHHIRGIQGADTIHRMTSNWKGFIKEIQDLCKDSMVSEILNIDVINRALTKMGGHPRPEMIFEEEFKIITRSLIVSRFIKRLNRKEVKM